jgi:DHA1 family multidrug resistance protein-like MFS transporter
MLVWYNHPMNSQSIKKTSSLFFLFGLFFVELIAANLAHPATPTLIVERGLPSSTFGLAFAAMSLGSFLFSPLWSYLNDRIGRVHVFALGCYGYAIGQTMFLFANQLWLIVLARFIAGVFVGGVMMTQLVLILDHSMSSDRAMNLSIHATLFTIGGALGYLVGGFLADIDLYLMFVIQIVALAGTGLVMHLFFQGIDVSTIQEKSSSFNPLRFFNIVIRIKPLEFTLFSVIVLLSMMGTVAFDQIFNFYLKDQLSFPASMNGIIKAAFGVMSLLVNITLGRMIIQKKWFKLPLSIVLLMTSTLALILVFFRDFNLFMVLSISFFVLNSLYLILVQVYSGHMSSFASNATVMGLYNAIRSLGMVLGSFLAGQLYQINISSSFAFSGISLGIAATFFVFAVMQKKV